MQCAMLAAPQATLTQAPLPVHTAITGSGPPWPTPFSAPVLILVAAVSLNSNWQKGRGAAAHVQGLDRPKLQLMCVAGRPFAQG